MRKNRFCKSLLARMLARLGSSWRVWHWSHQIGCDRVRGALQQEVADCFWVKLAGCTESIEVGFCLVQVVVERTSAETQTSDQGLHAATGCGELGLERDMRFGRAVSSAFRWWVVLGLPSLERVLSISRSSSFSSWGMRNSIELISAPIFTAVQFSSFAQFSFAPQLSLI